MCTSIEPAGGVEAAAHLLTFDSVHGRWPPNVGAEGGKLWIEEQALTFSEKRAPGEVPWQELGVEIVLECSGKFRTPALLAPYFSCGVKKVIVAAPVKEGGFNIVMGCNDQLYDPTTHLSRYIN